MKIVKGKYNIPDKYVFFMKSLLVNTTKSVLRFFDEDNFE